MFWRAHLEPLVGPFLCYTEHRVLGGPRLVLDCPCRRLVLVPVVVIVPVAVSVPVPVVVAVSLCRCRWLVVVPLVVAVSAALSGGCCRCGRIRAQSAAQPASPPQTARSICPREPSSSRLYPASCPQRMTRNVAG